MSGVRLTLRAEPSVALEAPGVRPDAFATLSEAEIARLPAWHGREAVRLLPDHVGKFHEGRMIAPTAQQPV